MANALSAVMARHRNVRGYNYDEGRRQGHARTLCSPFQLGSQTVGTTFHMLVSPPWCQVGVRGGLFRGSYTSSECQRMALLPGLVLSRDFCPLGLILFGAGEVLLGLIWEGHLKRLGFGDTHTRKQYHHSHCFLPGRLHGFM